MPAPLPDDDRRPSLDELTNEVEQALRQGGYAGRLERDAARGRLLLDGDAWLSLEHLYEQLAGHPRDRRRTLLEKMTAQVVSPATLPATWAQAAPLVRMVVKPKASHVVDRLRRETGVGPADAWTADLTEHLVLELAAPCAGGSLSVPKDTLANWGVTADDAFRVTVTTWRAGKPVALPRADAIVLRQGAKTLGLVRWNDLEGAQPGLLRRLPGYPPRFLATDFPEPWQLGALDLKPWNGPRDP